MTGDRRALAIRGRLFEWGARTYLMGIVNVTPDSFSGDGLLGGRGDPIAAAVAQALRMVDDGADLLDIGGESTRPGHEEVSVDQELARVVPVVTALRAALPEVPLSIDTTKPVVAAAALDAGADLVNDVHATQTEEAMAELAAERRVPFVVMDGRLLAADVDVVPAVTANLAFAVERAVRLGCDRDTLLVDPGIGFGKTAAQNLELLRGLASVRELGLPMLLGASRKSTIGKVLDLPVEERLEGTLATTALGIASGVDIVRVHDVAPNLRAARMADAILRGWHDPWRES